MRVLITGAGGQLGRALTAAAPAGAVVNALTRAELDIADADGVRAAFSASKPELVFNAAA